jgi:hypothetical protein
LRTAAFTFVTFSVGLTGASMWTRVTQLAFASLA